MKYKKCDLGAVYGNGFVVNPNCARILKQTARFSHAYSFDLGNKK
jgi:hypothetical protein